MFCEVSDLNETAPFWDTAELLVVIATGATCYTLWRIFVTNRSGPRGGVVVLGLDDSSSVYSDLSMKSVPTHFRVLYLAVSILTFMIGVMAHDGFIFLREYFVYW